MITSLDRAIFRIAGPDAARYLNGQLTNDIDALTPGTSCAAAVTDRKGKTDAAPVYVHRLAGSPDTFLLDAPRDLQESLHTRIDRYLIADDCTLEDATGDYTVLHSLGPTEPPSGALHTHHSVRYSFTGCDHIVPTTTAYSPPPPEFELSRVRSGIPAWGAELTHDTLPPEAGLDTFAISYSKGCYIGQEVISRIRSVGRVNRRLHRLFPHGDPAALAPATHLATQSGPTKPIGTITSVASDPATGTPAVLGYIDTRAAAPGDILHLTIGEKILSTTVEIGNTAPDFPAS